ncbi:MAG TPA: transcriptional regulator [Caulobacteraceae bacterium]|nr:transcriptional regulator [Caulobacteraceae bacterium]
MITFDTSLLLGLYGPTTASAGGAAARRKTDPTPPWDPKAAAPQAGELVKATLAGRRFVDPNGAKLDVPGASQDYRRLFALYQGLNALHGLAGRMDQKGVDALERAQIQRRFAAGLDEVGDFVEGLELEKLRLVRGEAAEKLKSQAGVRRDKAEYVAAVVHQGAADAPVAAFQGDVRFSITVQKTGGPVQVNVDLADMGAAPRTMSKVIEHLNAELQAAGVLTRVQRERIPGAPQTVTAGGKTVTLPATADRYALKVKGTIGETVSFSAPASADAVYLAQRAGKAEGGVQQLLKFQTDLNGGTAPPAASARLGESHWVDGRAFQTTLGPEVGTVRATAAGPDGAVWMLADLKGAAAGQPIKGERDVALLKYDSAGKLMFARTLGAGETASGFALSVAADGKVAVAGSVTGALDKGDDGLEADKADSFVTVFDAEGEELWTQRRGAREADEARAVAFGPDGKVYVTGRALSAMPGGGSASGGWDGYVQVFTPTAATATTPASAALKTVVQFGGAGSDRGAAVAADATGFVVAGVENGRAVLRRYSLNASGPPTLVASRDLGDLQGGEVTGVAIDGGRVIVTGTARNPSLSAGAVTRAHGGGSDVFVASLDAGLTVNASDRLTWYGGAGDDVSTAMTVSGGKVWLTGKAGTDLPGQTQVGAKDGFLARLDPTTGAIEWSRRFTAKDGEAAPAAVAVQAGGASVLDRLGLPKGTLDYADSKRVVAATAIRAGDRFFVRGSEGGAARSVTVEAADTLATLARKIERASGFRAKVEVVKDGDFDRLQIKARDVRGSIEVLAGEVGRDGLAALGLPEGTVRPKAAEDEPDDRPPVYGLKLSRTLRLDSKEAIKTAVDQLAAALSTVRTAYRDLVNAGKPPVPALNGPVPEHLQAQLANYRAALERLGG